MSEAGAVTVRLPGPMLGGAARRGPVARIGLWLRCNLFSSIGNGVLTLLAAGLIIVVGVPLFRWAVTDATLWGDTKSACVGDGACWAFIRMRLPLFLFGQYPAGERWRVIAALALLAAFAFPVLREGTRHRSAYLAALIGVYPIIAGLLLAGGVFGLTAVDTNLWGGLMLDVTISFVAVAGSLPLGIVLAFGRRSRLRVIRALSVGFIELWRGCRCLRCCSWPR